MTKAFSANSPDEQKKKVEAARSLDELKALAKEEGYELTPDELEAVSGSCWSCVVVCQKVKCHSYYG